MTKENYQKLRDPLAFPFGLTYNFTLEVWGIRKYLGIGLGIQLSGIYHITRSGGEEGPSIWNEHHRL